MSFNENAVSRELPVGMGEIAPSELRQVAQGEESSSPSVRTNLPGLAPWDESRFFWRANKNGSGYHLAPQESYVIDVLDRADHHMEKLANKLSDDDFEAFDASVKLLQDRLADETANDTTGIETADVLRQLFTRLMIARKVCGSCAVSAEHRTIREANKRDGDVEKMQADTSSTGYYVADVGKREIWGWKAVRLEYMAKAVADGEIIPKDDKLFSQSLATRIANALTDDAIKHGNQLKRPTSSKQSDDATVFTREQLLLLCA